MPEIFAYWLQAGRIDLGFLGGAQLDKFGNINSTVIGDYDAPRTRLPGAGGAPEIAASAGAVMVIMRQSQRAFVERCDFRSSVGFGDGPGDRERLGLRGGGVRWVITDLGVLEPDPDTCELTVRALHPGVTREQISDATGWPVHFADDSTRPLRRPSTSWSTLRTLQARDVDEAVHVRSTAVPDRVRARGAVAGGRRGRTARRRAGDADQRRDDRGVGRRGRGTARRRLALRWDEVAQHVPVELAERARAAATEHAIDAVVTIGGGSSTGLAKALALSHRVPIVAVPTTYAGSEQTTIYGLTGGQHKQTGKDPIVLPRVVVYDPELTLGLPPSVTGPSAFNALAHSVEALWAPGCNPITSALALEGVRAIAGSLPTVDGQPDRRRRPRRPALRSGACRAWRSARRRPGCTTSSATCSADASTSSTPTPTR